MAPAVSASAGRPTAARLRVSHADRDAVAERLSTAFAEGRLEHAEFNHRLDAAMAARTRADLAPLLADLAPAPPVARPAAVGQPVTSDERVLAMISHWSGLFTSFLGPLVVWAVKGRDSAFVRDQAMEALNFQLAFLLANVALIVATVVTLGLAALALPVLYLVAPVFVIVGGVGAATGKPFRYPLNLRLVR